MEFVAHKTEVNLILQKTLVNDNIRLFTSFVFLRK